MTNFIEDEFNDELRNERRGMLTMARGRGKNTNGSQFLLLLDKLPFLDGTHTVFGRVTGGADVLDLLEKLGQPREGSQVGNFAKFHCILGKNP